VRESGWLRFIEDEDSVPVIRHRLPPTFRNQVPSTRVDEVRVHLLYIVGNSVTNALT